MDLSQNWNPHQEDGPQQDDLFFDFSGGRRATVPEDNDTPVMGSEEPDSPQEEVAVVGEVSSDMSSSSFMWVWPQKTRLLETMKFQVSV